MALRSGAAHLRSEAVDLSTCVLLQEFNEGKEKLFKQHESALDNRRCNNHSYSLEIEENVEI